MKIIDELSTPFHTNWSIEEVVAQYDGRINGIHDVCWSKPEISRFDFDCLMVSIKKHGVVMPVLVDKNGLLIDGRSRLVALSRLERELPDNLIAEVHADPHVIAEANVMRRHLTLDQKVMAVVEMFVQRFDRKKIDEVQKPSPYHSDADVVSEEELFRAVLGDEFYYPGREVDPLYTKLMYAALSLHLREAKLTPDVRNGYLELSQAGPNTGFESEELRTLDQFGLLDDHSDTGG